MFMIGWADEGRRKKLQPQLFRLNAECSGQPLAAGVAQAGLAALHLGVGGLADAQALGHVGLGQAQVFAPGAQDAFVFML